MHETCNTSLVLVFFVSYPAQSLPLCIMQNYAQVFVLFGICLVL